MTENYKAGHLADNADVPDAIGTVTSPEDPDAVWVPTRLSDDERRKQIRDILLNAALKSGTAVDDDELDAATESLCATIKAVFS